MAKEAVRMPASTPAWEATIRKTLWLRARGMTLPRRTVIWRNADGRWGYMFSDSDPFQQRR